MTISLSSAAVWVRRLLLERAPVVGALVLGLGLFGIAALTGQLFLVDFSGMKKIPGQEADKLLKVELIDQLEFWIEEVDAERQKGLPVPSRPLFASEEIAEGP